MLTATYSPESTNKVKIGHKSPQPLKLPISEGLIFIVLASLRVSFSSPSRCWCYFGSHRGLIQTLMDGYAITRL